MLLLLNFLPYGVNIGTGSALIKYWNPFVQPIKKKKYSQQLLH